MLYQEILDKIKTSISIIDSKTYELYYANEESFKLYNRVLTEYEGKKCYEAFCNAEEPCKNCKPGKCTDGDDSFIISASSGKKTISSTQRIAKWMGIDTIIVFSNDITKEVNQRSEIENEKERYRIIIDQMGLALFDFDFVSKQFFCNKAYNNYALSREAVSKLMENKGDRSLIYPEDFGRLDKFFSELRCGNAEAVIRMKTVKGDFRWTRVRGNVVFGQNGMPERAIGTFEDIHDRQERSIGQFEKYSSIINQSTVNNITLCNRVSINATKNIISLSDTAPDDDSKIRSGMSYNEFNDICINKAADMDSKKILSDFLNTLGTRSFEDERETFEYQYLRLKENGSRHWIRLISHLTINPFTNDRMAYMFFYDGTNEIIEKQLINQVVLENFDYLGVIDTKTHLIDYAIISPNVPIKPHVGKSYEDEFEKYLASYFETGDVKKYVEENKLNMVLDNLKKNRIYSSTIDLSIKGDSRRKVMQYMWFDDAKSKIVFSRTDVTSSYKRDLLHNSRIVEALKRAEEANAAKSDFLSRVSHDIRTPLNAIIGFSDLALDDMELKANTKDSLLKINSSGTCLLGLINDILDMSKIESNKMKLNEAPVNPRSFLKEIADIFYVQANLKGITLRTDFEIAENEPFLMDALRCRQIYNNVLSNAIKFSDRGTTISWKIKSAVVNEKRIRITSVISDQGCGIGKEYMSKLFHPFEQEINQYSVSETGTGLGLSIVKSLVELMGGSIDLRSEKGVGTTVTIVLEHHICKQNLNADEQSSTFFDDNVLKGLHVLLCEDHPLNREIAIKLLGKKHIAVDVAVNGKEGLEMFSHSNPNFYDAILMDIRMPVMDGLETTKSIRSLNRTDATEIPIIALTANAYTEDIKKCISAGMTGHVSKPIEKNALYSEIYRAVNKCNENDEAER